LGTVTWAWLAMFVYTLFVPYYILEFWGSLYHKFPSKVGLNLGAGLILTAIQTCVLGLFPIYTVVHHQLPPASRFIVILEQVSVSNIFQLPILPFLSNTHLQGILPSIFGCLFYGYFILVRLCIPVFRPETNQPFSKRTMVLAVFHSILPGIL
ncbi:hypothetical protein GOODEAATRI_009192, partial [Goodea atripinnis]